MTKQLSLFPEIEPFDHGKLKVDDEHTLHYEQCGNPKGKPAVFLHGGPGAGADPKARRFWDPAVYRIILFDQRGCGRSTPHASLNNNTTWDLVEDIEKLRNHLKIAQWQVFGGSWGSCLALSYAVRYPEKISEMVLRGIFTLREKELTWFYQYGGHFIYPDTWQTYWDLIPPKEQGQMMEAYYQRLTSSDEKTKLEAAKRWSVWEASTSKLYMDQNFMEKSGQDLFALAFARIECHYFINKGFFPEDGYLLNQVDTYRHIPTTIVQGRYDVVCPMITAYELSQRWPEAEFHVVQDAGHNAFEPGIQTKLLEATEKYK